MIIQTENNELLRDINSRALTTPGNSTKPNNILKKLRKEMMKWPRTPIII